MMLGLCSIYFSKLQRKQMNSVILEVLENASLYIDSNCDFYIHPNVIFRIMYIIGRLINI
jgi:hypothetical protein